MEKTLARMYLETVLQQFGLKRKKGGKLIGDAEYRKAAKNKKGK